MSLLGPRPRPIIATHSLEGYRPTVCEAAVARRSTPKAGDRLCIRNASRKHKARNTPKATRRDAMRHDAMHFYQRPRKLPMFFNVSEHTIGVTPCDATRSDASKSWKASVGLFIARITLPPIRCHDDDADQMALQRTRCVHSKRPQLRAIVGIKF